MKYFVIIVAFFLTVPFAVSGQTAETADFRSIVERVIETRFKRSRLADVCPLSDPAAARVFADYGAIFVAQGVLLPGRCIFQTENEVQSFQAQAEPFEALIGGTRVILQKAAINALLDAQQDARKKRLVISARGGAAASTRSYSKTVELWNSRLLPALNYWTKKGKISRAEADAARNASIADQVDMVLAWEEKGLFFSKDLSKSILYSVAVPGASQHIFMLALDVEQYANPQVREILANHGWFQTVKSDLPHFTYLGLDKKDLRDWGLIEMPFNGQKFWIPKIP